jgi:hypothetical protein
VRTDQRTTIDSGSFDLAIPKIIIKKNCPDTIYISDRDIARQVEGKKPSKGTVIKAWWHMAGAIAKGQIIVNSTVPAVKYRILKVQDPDAYPHRAICCVKDKVKEESEDEEQPAT